MEAPVVFTACLRTLIYTCLAEHMCEDALMPVCVRTVHHFMTCARFAARVLLHRRECLSAELHTCLHTCLHTSTHISTHMSIHMPCLHTNVTDLCIHMSILTHRVVYTYVYTHVYTYFCKNTYFVQGGVPGVRRVVSLHLPGLVCHNNIGHTNVGHQKE